MSNTISYLNTLARNFEIAYADKSVTTAEFDAIALANRLRATNNAQEISQGRQLFDAAELDFYAAYRGIATNDNGVTCRENHFPTGEGLAPNSSISCQAYNRAITRMQVAAGILERAQANMHLSFGFENWVPEAWQ